MRKLLTLAIPTNGIIEWVLPVLDSIYGQGVEDTKFEVVVTDNGSNEDFHNKMISYCKEHENLIYRKTSVVLFMNQVEAFKLASGEFVKFVNHRTKLNPGTLQYLVEFVENNIYDRPISFFLNGALDPRKKNEFYSGFDSFVYGLSYYSSWSGGVACWKRDLEKILKESLNDMNLSLFPHTRFIFIKEDNRKYYIDNQKLFEEIPNKAISKGRYDLFYAFGVEYMNIILGLLERSKIDKSTFAYVKEENEKFIIELFTNYVLLNNECAYDLSSARRSLNVFYSYRLIKMKAIINLGSKAFKRVKNLIKRH